MPELKEVFEMVTKQTEPELDSWKEQERRQRRTARNRKVGALALVATIAAIATVAAIALPREEPPIGVGTNPLGTNPPLPSRPGVYLVDVATGKTTLVPGIDPGGSSFDVSPDGTMMTFAGLPGNKAIHVADVDGSNVRALEQTAATGEPMAPRWSPDGSTIVYQGKGSGERIGNLFVVDVTTGVTTRITDLRVGTPGFYYMAPTFTADGGSILFTMPGGNETSETWNLWSVPATGVDPTLIRQNAGLADSSPNGALAYVGIGNDPFGDAVFDDLFVSEDGIGRERLVEGVIVQPRWSPDGSMIAYEAGEEIHVVDVSTGQTSVAFDARGQFPEWVDDDTLIIDLTD